MKAEDCRPNKTLRLTTRAFLKKLAAQREQGQKKIAAATAAGPPATVPTSHNDGLSASTTTNFLSSLQQADGTQISQEAFTTSPSTEQTKPLTIGEPLPTEAQKDVPQPSIEVCLSHPVTMIHAKPLQATEDRVREESFQEQDRGDVAASNQDIQNDGAQQPQSAQNMQPQAMTNGTGAGQGMNGTGFGFDGMTNGFPTMAFTNGMDFNSMTQFMPNNAMGGFPNMMGEFIPPTHKALQHLADVSLGMPGMPGMGMDPMQAMSQGMFGGFGGPGMGMNGVNAGMGFPAGQTWNGGFNGQPGSWMSGQDKFNQNAYGGHANGMGGDFGANAGYSGYNQGNYNQMNPHQFPNHDFQNGYHGQGFHSRGRGRGRGYHPYAARGRGSYNQVNGSYANHEPFHHQSPSQHPRQDTSYSQNPQQIQDGEKSQVDEFGRDISGYKKTEEPTDEQLARSLAPGDADEHEGLTGPNITAAEGASTSADANGEPPKPSAGPSAPIEGPKEPVRDGEKPNEMQQEQQKDKPALIETVVSDEATRAEPTSPSSAVTANTMLPPPTPAIPQNPRSSSRVDEKSYEYNARGRFPNGPSEYRGTGRDRGSTHATSETTNHIRTGFQPAVPPVTAPIEPKGLGVEGAPKGPKAMREGLPNTGIRGGRGFSIVGRAAAAVHSRPNGNTRSRR